MQCLIIDDSRAMRRILQQIIERLGFETLLAAHGQEGLKQLDVCSDVTLALVDWNMPVMNGLEFIKAARQSARYDKLKIVMVTTETEPIQFARAFMAGADEFVTKPFTAATLLEKLKLIGVRITAQ